MFQVVCRNYTNTDTQARRAPPQHTQTHRAKLLRFSTASPILIQDYHFHKIKKKNVSPFIPHHRVSSPRSGSQTQSSWTWNKRWEADRLPVDIGSGEPSLYKPHHRREVMSFIIRWCLCLHIHNVELLYVVSACSNRLNLKAEVLFVYSSSYGNFKTTNKRCVHSITWCHCAKDASYFR